MLLAGDVLLYRFDLENQGTVTIKGPSISDAKLTSALVCSADDLAPGATRTCQGSYVVQQSDLDTSVINTATSNFVNGDANTARTVSAVVYASELKMAATVTASQTSYSMAGKGKTTSGTARLLGHCSFLESKIGLIIDCTCGHFFTLRVPAASRAVQ